MNAGSMSYTFQEEESRQADKEKVASLVPRQENHQGEQQVRQMMNKSNAEISKTDETNGLVESEEQTSRTWHGHSRSSHKQPLRGPINVPNLYESGDSAISNETSYLYSNTRDRILEMILNVILCRCDVTFLLNDYRAMELNASKAIQHSKELDYEPLTARCHFVLGIALFHQRAFSQALQEFKDAKLAVGKYIRDQKLKQWVDKTEEGLTTDTPITPASPYPDSSPRPASDASESPINQTAPNSSEETDIAMNLSRRASKTFVKPLESPLPRRRTLQQRLPHLRTPSLIGKLPSHVLQTQSNGSPVAQSPLARPSSRNSWVSEDIVRSRRMSAFASSGPLSRKSSLLGEIARPRRMSALASSGPLSRKSSLSGEISRPRRMSALSLEGTPTSTSSDHIHNLFGVGRQGGTVSDSP